MWAANNLDAMIAKDADTKFIKGRVLLALSRMGMDYVMSRY